MRSVINDGFICHHDGMCLSCAEPNSTPIPVIGVGDDAASTDYTVAV